MKSLSCQSNSSVRSVAASKRSLIQLRHRLGVVGVLATVSCSFAILPAHAAAPSQQVFEYTRGPQSFTVPAGVHSLSVDAYGAIGASGASLGGYGAHVQATLPVSAGQTLAIVVGGGGERGAGGFNGGANAGRTDGDVGLSEGGGGGGASDVRLGSERLVVAGGGGGGAGCATTDSNASCASGQAGQGGKAGATASQGGAGSPGKVGAAGTGGLGGTDSQAGAGGSHGGAAGSGAAGGSGGEPFASWDLVEHTGGGGGGGGGWNGGGGGGAGTSGEGEPAMGGNGGGGGAGSSYASSHAADVSIETGSVPLAGYNGIVILTYA